MFRNTIFIAAAFLMLLSINMPVLADTKKNADNKSIENVALIEKPRAIQGDPREITNKIYDDIFDTSNTSGNYSLPGGGDISFVRAGGNVVITIVDIHGIVSEITVPDA